MCEQSDIDQNLIAVMPCIENIKTELFVLDVHSPSSKRGLTHNFGALFLEAMAKASYSPFPIHGGFSAPHTQREYGADSRKGKKLAELMDVLDLVLLNEPASRTWIGQDACRNTSLISPFAHTRARLPGRTPLSIGGDHRVPCVTMGADEAKMNGCQKARVVDLDKLRNQRKSDKRAGLIDDIGEWCREILVDVEKTTKEIELPDRRKEPER
ncbi:hypothetical protein MRX96_048904 [Rhipicephalus microplus]